MLEDIQPTCVYRSASGFIFQVLLKGWHGQDCSEPMVCYTNLQATADKPAHTIWMIPESIFLRRFSEIDKWEFPECINPQQGDLLFWESLSFTYTEKGWQLLTPAQHLQVPSTS